MVEEPPPIPPPPSTATIDPERQKHAKVYARISRRLMLVDLAFGALYLVAWLAFGWSKASKNFYSYSPRMTGFWWQLSQGSLVASSCC